MRHYFVSYSQASQDHQDLRVREDSRVRRGRLDYLDVTETLAHAVSQVR